jgi:hypothetical protein
MFQRNYAEIEGTGAGNVIDIAEPPCPGLAGLGGAEHDPVLAK